MAHHFKPISLFFIRQLFDLFTGDDETDIYCRACHIRVDTLLQYPMERNAHALKPDPLKNWNRERKKVFKRERESSKSTP